MKKFLTVLLAFSMLLTVMVVPLYASDSTTIGADLSSVSHITIADDDGDGKVTINEKEYTVISKAKQLIDGFTTAGNYILANDIDFAEEGTIISPFFTVSGDILLEGNGYSLTNLNIAFSSEGNGLIKVNSTKDTKYTSTVNNLKITATATLPKHCAVLWGFVQYTTYVADNVWIDADVAQNGQSVGVFAARSNGGSATFTNCTATGDWEFLNYALQCGGFIGLNQAAATFENCSVNSNIKSGSERRGGFIGESSKVVTFKNCSFEGTAHGTVSSDGSSSKFSRQFGGFVGYVSAAVKTTFTDCSVSATISSCDRSAGFIGQMGNNNGATAEFNGTCSFSGNVITYLYSGAFIGYNLSNSSTPVVIADGASCTSTGSMIGSSVTVLDGETTTANIIDKEDLGDDCATSGALTYALAKAQKGLNITDVRYVFGQTLGTDSTPVLGGATVYEIDTLRSDAFYSNTYTGVSSVDVSEVPVVYTQTTTETDGKLDVRVIIAVKEEKLDDIASLSLTAAFNESGDKKLTLGLNDVSWYYSVYAGNEVAEAPDGYVLIAFAVTNIVVADWDGALAVNMTATDSQGNTLNEYTVSNSGNCLPK